jgi:hypothetical protein
MEMSMADLDTLLSSAQGGRLIDNLAQRFGLSDAQVESAIKALAPALSFGVEKAVESPEGFEKVVACLGAARDCCAHDHAEAAVAEDSVARGNSAVLSLFGSQDNTSQILQAASQQSGVPVDILGQLMPIIASVLLSGLNKTVNEQGLGGLLGQLASSGALGNILGQVLGGGAPAGQGGRSGGAAGGGLGDILGQVLGGGQPPRPAPRGEPAGGPGGGLLGSILGGLLGGGGPRPRGGPAADPLGGGRAPSSGRDPLETAAASGGAGGLDPAAVQDAINRIRETLQIGQGGAAAPSAQGGGQSELEKILGQLLGGRKA